MVTVDITFLNLEQGGKNTLALTSWEFSRSPSCLSSYSGFLAYQLATERKGPSLSLGL